MSEHSKDLTSPVGRLVGGSVWEGRPNDDDGVPYAFKTGKNIGQPYNKFSFGIAIEKHNMEYPVLQNIAQQVASAGFPQGQSNAPTFAWKVTDGDSTVPNTKGNLPCQREGYPGHWIIWFSGTNPPRVYDENRQLLIDPISVKKGYYIRVAGSVDANGDQRKPGLYWNYSMVQRVAYGEEIASGPDAEAVFGAVTGGLPAGALTTAPAPAMGAPAPAPAMGAPAMGAPAMGAPAPAMGAPAPAMGAPAPAMGAPAPAMGAPAIVAAPPVAAPPVAAPPLVPDPNFANGPRMAKDGNTVETYLTAGWTEDQMKAGGLL